MRGDNAPGIHGSVWRVEGPCCPGHFPMKMPALDGYAEACSVNYVPIHRG